MKKLTFSFLVLGMMLMAIGSVSAAHSSDVVISSDGWLKPNTLTDFDITVTHSSADSDEIKRVIVELPLSGYSTLVCNDVTGWTITSSNEDYCIYDADTSGEYLATGESKTFEVQTTTTADIGTQTWAITTRDNNFYSTTSDIAPTAPTIQEVLDSTDAGSTINIPAGTYTEDLTIDKSITLDGSEGVTIIGEHTITANDVTLDDFTFTPTGDTTLITIDSSASTIDSVAITNSIFGNSVNEIVAVNLGGSTPTNAISNIDLSSNTFNGPANMICNAFKVGGAYGAHLDVSLNGFTFSDNEVNSCSSPLNLQDGNLNAITIDNNVFRNTDGAVYVWTDEGSNPTGILSNFVFTNNDLDSTNSYGVAFFAWHATNFIVDTELDDANFGLGNMINNNKFVGNSRINCWRKSKCSKFTCNLNNL